MTKTIERGEHILHQFNNYYPARPYSAYNVLGLIQDLFHRVLRIFLCLFIEFIIQRGYFFWRKKKLFLRRNCHNHFVVRICMYLELHNAILRVQGIYIYIV